jgi:hypothetical protein
MTAELKRMLTCPGLTAIIIPFHHQVRLGSMIPLCDDRGFCMAIARYYYDPAHYPPGSCVQ